MLIKLERNGKTTLRWGWGSSGNSTRDGELSARKQDIKPSEVVKIRKRLP